MRFFLLRAAGLTTEVIRNMFGVDEYRKKSKIREQMQDTEVRYLPKEIISPMWIEIFGDYVAIGAFILYQSKKR